MTWQFSELLSLRAVTKPLQLFARFFDASLIDVEARTHYNVFGQSYSQLYFFIYVQKANINGF